MLAENKIIRGLWIGSELTKIQQLSIQSFLDNGHDYHLYTYGPVKHVPPGAIIEEASKVLPWARRQDFQNDANFSDLFRTTVTWLRGGWYCDTDIVCLKPFDFEEPRVFVSEYQFGNGNPLKTEPLVNGCILKIPIGDPMTGEILRRIKELDTLHCGWIDVGPTQYRWGVNRFTYRGSIQHPDVFDSLWPDHHDKFVFGKTGDWKPAEHAYAIHLRTSYWSPQNKLDPNGTYPPESEFECLKRKHGI